MNQLTSSPSPAGFLLAEKVSELSELILAKHPKMPVLLREIHTALRAQPENVTLLPEEQIGIIVAGLSVQTGVEFAAAVTKPKGGNTPLLAKIKKLGVNAF